MITPRRPRHPKASTLGFDSLEDRALASADLRGWHPRLNHPRPLTGRLAEFRHDRSEAARVTRAEAPRSTGAHAESRRGAAMAPVRSLQNVVYQNQRGRQERLDLYLPTGPAPAGGRPVILALPGGGWRWVRRADLGVTVSSFAKDGYVVAVADYAFATDSTSRGVWPANFEDVRQAVRWLKSNAARFGIDPNRIAVWGESSGGHLASLLGTDPEGPSGATPSNVSARVQAVIDFYGPEDLTRLYQDAMKTRPYLATFLGGSPDQAPDRYQEASPISHVSPDDPPFLIFQGMNDTSVPPTQSIAFAQALTDAGVPNRLELVPGVGHGFRLKAMPGVDTRAMILAFLNSALNGSA